MPSDTACSSASPGSSNWKSHLSHPHSKTCEEKFKLAQKVEHEEQKKIPKMIKKNVKMLLKTLMGGFSWFVLGQESTSSGSQMMLEPILILQRLNKKPELKGWPYLIVDELVLHGQLVGRQNDRR